MRIHEIDHSMKKKEHDLWLIKILSYFIKDDEMQHKVKYTSNLFHELSQNLQRYKKNQNEEIEEEAFLSLSTLYNYLDNDDVTYDHAISEMKDEIYTYYTVQTILIFDNLTNDELANFYTQIIKQSHTEIEKVIHLKIESNINQINQFIATLNQECAQGIDEKNQKFIPLTIRNNSQIDKMVSSTFYLNLFQDIKRALKYLSTEYQKKQIYQTMLEIYLLIIIDNNLKRR